MQCSQNRTPKATERFHFWKLGWKMFETTAALSSCSYEVRRLLGVYRKRAAEEVQQLPMLFERMLHQGFNHLYAQATHLLCILFSVVVLSLRGFKEKNLVGVVVPLLLIAVFVAWFSPVWA